jgi:hypothetical protein
VVPSILTLSRLEPHAGLRAEAQTVVFEGAERGEEQRRSGVTFGELDVQRPVLHPLLRCQTSPSPAGRSTDPGGGLTGSTSVSGRSHPDESTKSTQMLTLWNGHSYAEVGAERIGHAAARW